MANREPFWNEAFMLAAGDVLTIDITGSYFRFDSSDVELKVSFNDGSAYPFPVGYGLPVEIRRLRIENPSASVANFRATVAASKVADNRLEIVGGITLSKPSVLSESADLAVASGATVVLLAAKAARREAIIKNPSSAAGNIRVGAAPSAVQGQEIEPGQMVIVSTSAEIKVYNASAASISVQRSEIED